MQQMRPDPGSLLEGLFTSRVRVKVLTLLVAGDTGPIHARELAKVTGEHFNAVWQELKHLESLGVLLSARVGNHVDYLPNPDLPLMAELRQLLARGAGLTPQASAPEPVTQAAPAFVRQYPRRDATIVFGETD